MVWSERFVAASGEFPDRLPRGHTARMRPSWGIDMQFLTPRPVLFLELLFIVSICR